MFITPDQIRFISDARVLGEPRGTVEEKTAVSAVSTVAHSRLYNGDTDSRGSTEGFFQLRQELAHRRRKRAYREMRECSPKCVGQYQLAQKREDDVPTRGWYLSVKA